MANRKPQAAASKQMLPRILVIDDTFGRNVHGGRNEARENLCASFLWLDATDDDAARANRQRILDPVAEVVFCRAQSPASAEVGETVENDLGMALEAVRNGWCVSNQARPGHQPKPPNVPWSMALIDLCFYTGRVTEESHRSVHGMPEGRPTDDDARTYFGLTLLDAIHGEFPELPIFILSSKPRAEVSLEFSRRGALGFIDRGALDGPELLTQAMWNHGLLPDTNEEVVGQSLPILLALREARRSAGQSQNVLIRGERGSGKELMARYLHWARAKRSIDTGNAPGNDSRTGGFTTVNSAVLTPNLFASELFGIEPRTATGVDGKIGLIEMADGGDLFLDEIGDMPPEVQASMLRVLQERQITRVGARKSREIDVRFISATNLDLDTPERGFRADLLDRLRTGGTIWLPALRERPVDIPLLVERFLREAESVRPGSRTREITPDALELLGAYEWPGNIRELRSVIYDAVGRHPDVEYLVPAHLRLTHKPIGGTRKAFGELSPTSKSDITESHDLGALMRAMEQHPFKVSKAGDWAGRLADLQIHQARLAARLCEAALKATMRRTPENPRGIIQIHPAMKLASGDAAMTATKAADMLKRVLSPIHEELAGDLKEAYETALRLRPRNAPRQRGPGSPRQVDRRHSP